MKKVFKVEEKEYAIMEPTAVIRREAQTEHSKIFGRCLKDVDIITRSELESLVKNRKTWNAEKVERKEFLETDLREKVIKLSGGGLRLTEAKKLALDITDVRAELRNLEYEYREYDQYTAEARAEEAEKDYLITHCLVNNDDGKRVYKSVEEYVEDKDSDISMMAIINMMDLTYGSIDDIYRQLPENAFLIEYGFMNDKIQLINENGELVDREGRLIDENGYYINEDKKFVDKDGKLIEKFEKKPFLDDNDNPIVKDKVEESQTEENVVTTEVVVENPPT